MRLSLASGDQMDLDQVDLDRVDLVDPNLYGTGDPHRIWREMRRRRPVHWQQVEDGIGFWSATTHADVSTVLRDHTAFTAERGSVLELLGTGDPAGGRQLAVTDPPRHTAMRAPIQRVLAMRSVERDTELIAAEIDRILAGAGDGGVIDIAELAHQVPMAVAGRLLGLDRRDWPMLTRLTTLAVAPHDPAYRLPQGATATVRRAHRELFAYFSAVVADRARPVGDDLVSLLLTIAVENGRRLDRSEVVSNCYGLVLGANVTMPHAISGAVLELMATDGWADWAAHQELLDSGVEEALRWSSPANHFMRHALRDVELGGRRIAAGEAVVAWIGSANRDETVFPDPYRFDIRRSPNRHIAFGVGPHYCVGHAVARVSLRLFFAELLRRFEALEPAGPVEHLHSNFVAGIKSLPAMARTMRRSPSRVVPANASSTTPDRSS
jgi:cytochrome P450